MNHNLFLFITCFFFLVTSNYIQKVNGFFCGAGNVYFGDLTLNSAPYYQVSYSGDQFNFNICGTVTSEYCISKPNCASCQSSGGSQFSTGQYSSTATIITATSDTSPVGGSIIYTGGDVCSGQPNEPSRQTTINLICSDNEIPIITMVEETCAYLITFTSKGACGVLLPSNTPSPSISPKPLPSKSSVGNSPCNPIKVKSFPSSFHGNLAFGASYNGSCLIGPSNLSQFYYIYPSFNGNLTISTCNSITRFDSEINLYSGSTCSQLKCIANNDDGCGSDSTSSYLMVPVTAYAQYYLEVRAFGQPTNIPTIYQIIFDLTP